MSCNVGEVTERLENEFCCTYHTALCSFSILYVTSPTSQLILQYFRRFTYVTAYSPTLPLLHLRHSLFSNPSFASPTSQALHLRHLASRPWCRSIVCLKFMISSKLKLKISKFHLLHQDMPYLHLRINTVPYYLDTQFLYLS